MNSKQSNLSIEKYRKSIKIDRKISSDYRFRFSMLKFDLIDFNQQVSEYEKDVWREIRLRSNAD